MEKKSDDVKIIQMSIEPYIYYQSNGSMYKDKIESRHIFGLGDDGNVYRWGNHIFYRRGGYNDKEEWLGWILYSPKE